MTRAASSRWFPTFGRLQQQQRRRRRLRWLIFLWTINLCELIYTATISQTIEFCSAFAPDVAGIRIPRKQEGASRCNRNQPSFRYGSANGCLTASSILAANAPQNDVMDSIHPSNDMETVRSLTTVAVFGCGTEEGLEALAILNDLCDRRLSFDFDAFSEEQQRRIKARTKDHDSAMSVGDPSFPPDEGEKIVSRLPGFLPEATVRDFLASARAMEEEGWMSTNPDSVDGLPSLHVNLVSQGKPLYADDPNDDDEEGDGSSSFGARVHELYELVRPYVYEELLPEANRLLLASPQKASGNRRLRVSDVFLRRYGTDICGSVTRKGISIHYDVYSRITAVVALDETACRGDNGLFTLHADEVSGESSNHKALRRFFPLDTGDCVLHTWDVLHGVDVEEGLDRTSLIVWFDEEDEPGKTGEASTDPKETSPLLSPWLSLEHSNGSPSDQRTTLEHGNDVRQFVLASALASAASSPEASEDDATVRLYLASAARGNTFALTRMGSLCEEGALPEGELRTEAFRVLDALRSWQDLPEILQEMLTDLDDDDGNDHEASVRTELACRFWLEGSLTGNPLAQTSLADELMFASSRSGNPDQRLLAATLFALASQQEGEPSDALARVIEFDVAARGVESQEEFLASPVVRTAQAALGGL